MASKQYSEAYLAQTRGKPAEIGMYVVTALSTGIVLVRLYARGFLIRELGWDDYIIVVSQVRPLLLISDYTATILMLDISCSYLRGLIWYCP